MSAEHADRHEPHGSNPANRSDYLSGQSLAGADSPLRALREQGRRLLANLAEGPDAGLYQRLHWQGSFDAYLAITQENPLVLRNAWQRLYDAITHFGVTRSTDGTPHYKIFDDPFNGGKDAVFGLDRQLNELVNIIRAGAEGLGPQHRFLLLHGPVGTAKSTIARILKNGVEYYSKVDEGALYTIGFKIHPGHPEYDPNDPAKVKWCPNNEEPLRVVPARSRADYIAGISEGKSIAHELAVKGECCPACRQEIQDILQRSNGSHAALFDNVVVKRLILSESDRIGIGTFQPKDEKNQDSTELSGDINFRKIAVYGSDSDPRAFNFDGEFNIANRGILEFVEVLKLETAFLYDLLGATQEHRIKPKKFAQTDIDEVVIGHTNEPEYKKLVADDKMEALRDRIIKIDIPYLTRLDHEERIYTNQFKRVANRIAPHTLEVAAMWAILTRLEEPNDQRLGVMQKLKLYNGELAAGISDAGAAAERARELKGAAPKEGMSGISPRYVIDTISTTLAGAAGESITPLQLINALHEKLRNNAMIKDEKILNRYRRLLDEVKGEYERIVKTEVREAVVRSDPEAIRILGENYIDSVQRHVAILEGEFRSDEIAPNAALMTAIESKMNVHPSQADDVRRTLVNTMRVRAEQGRAFDAAENEQLRTALEDKYFEDCKDTLKLAPLKGRADDSAGSIVRHLMRTYGYTDSSAREVLAYVADIYARGETRKK